MKKVVLVFLSLVLLCTTVGCGGKSGGNSKDDSNPVYDVTDSKNDYIDNSIGGYTDYSPKDYVSQDTDYGNTVSESHTHYYTSSVTKEATCASAGVRTFKCDCGKSYTESIEKNSNHDWEYATCTSPKRCKVCGSTEGTAEGHRYDYYGKCYSCGKVNPAVSKTLASCSLSIPAVPKTVSHYSYSNKLYTSVNVTAITYKFECNNNGEISLKLYFSGEKTYDYRGAGQSDSCLIGWKLYAPNGSVIRSGTVYSPNIAMGESFSNKEETALFTSDKGASGAYRLEISNVN